MTPALSYKAVVGEFAWGMGVVMGKTISDYEQQLAKLQEQNEVLLAFVRDIRDHGFRADPMPSMTKERDVMWWYEYLTRINKSLRSRAREAIRRSAEVDTMQKGGRVRAYSEE